MSSDRIGSGVNRPVQVRKIRRDGWTTLKRQQFLAGLAEHCNVTRAANAAGMSTNSVYALRRKNPAFATAWTEALRIGFEQLEQQLLRHLFEEVDPVPVRDDGTNGAARRLSGDEIKLMIFLLGRHRTTVDGKGSKGGSGRASAEETKAALIAKLDALDRQRRAVA